MGSTYLTDPLIFLIDSVFSLYILAALLRFLLQWGGAGYYNEEASPSQSRSLNHIAQELHTAANSAERSIRYQNRYKKFYNKH